MNKALRITAIVVAVLLVVVFIVPFLVPVNQFKPTIEQKASEALGRKVQMGNLSFSVLGRSLSAENLLIADDPNFSKAPFLTAKSIKVGVEILPLIFSRALDITTITIDSPQIALIRGPQAQWNYSTLGGAAKSGATAKSASGASGEPDVSIGKLELKNGRVSIGNTGSDKVNAYDHVDVTASDVSLTSQFPVKVSVDLPGGGSLKLEGKVGPVDATDAVLTPVNATLDIKSLDLASTGVLDPSAGLSGLLDFQATVSSQSGQSEVKGSAKLSKALLVRGGSPAPIPLTIDFGTQYNLQKNTGVLEPSTINIGSTQAKLSGTYEVPPGGAVLNVKVDAENMPVKDLQKFLPALGVHLPNGASLERGTLSANLNLTGPTTRMITAGNVGMYNARLVGFDLGSKIPAASSLLGVKTGKDLDIEKMTSNVRVAPDGIKTDNVDVVVPSLGTVIGGGTIDAQNNMDFKMVATLKGDPNSSNKCKSGMTVPFQIHGTTADPKFQPDVGGAAAGLVKSGAGCAADVAKGAVSAPVKSVGSMFKKKPF